MEPEGSLPYSQLATCPFLRAGWIHSSMSHFCIWSTLTSYK